ncbi:MAG TPA: hypothetical protein ENH02_05910 [Bacteroidetes bacterium]|nr:hypothetical protein [Bacteroidota bacterium]
MRFDILSMRHFFSSTDKSLGYCSCAPSGQGFFPKGKRGSPGVSFFPPPLVSSNSHNQLSWPQVEKDHAGSN